MRWRKIEAWLFFRFVWFRNWVVIDAERIRWPRTRRELRWDEVAESDIVCLLWSEYSHVTTRDGRVVRIWFNQPGGQEPRARVLAAVDRPGSGPSCASPNSPLFVELGSQFACHCSSVRSFVYARPVRQRSRRVPTAFDHDELSKAEAQEGDEVEEAKQGEQDADGYTQPGEENAQ